MALKINLGAAAVALVAAVALLAVPGMGMAQGNPTFQYEKPPEKAEEWRAQAKGGRVMTSGNSQSLNGVLGLTGSCKAGDDKLSLEGGVA